MSRRGHRRLLATALLGFGVLQPVAGAVAAGGGASPLYWAVALLGAVAYALGAWAVWRAVRWASVLAAALSVIALVAFPIGTAVGAYGLYAAGRTARRRRPPRRAVRTRRMVRSSRVHAAHASELN